MKHELIMSGLLILGNPMMANAQQTKTTTAESISTDSIQAMKEKLRQSSHHTGVTSVNILLLGQFPWSRRGEYAYFTLCTFIFNILMCKCIL